MAVSWPFPRVLGLSHTGAEHPRPGRERLSIYTDSAAERGLASFLRENPVREKKQGRL